MYRFLIPFLLCLTSAQALVLENLIQQGKLQKTFSNKKIGYYIGSFDPLHLGHQDVAQIPLEGLVDYVLIFPNWGGDTYKKRIPIEKRLKMLFSVFKDHPRVIVTNLSPREMQHHLTVPDPSHTIDGKPIVKPAFEGTEFVGIVGSDSAIGLGIPLEDPEKEKAREKYLTVFMRGIQVADKHARGTIGGLIGIPVNAFIVAERDGEDVSVLKDKIGDRPILAIIQNTNHAHVSSTKVKKRLRDSQSLDEMVDSKVNKIIHEDRLYHQ